MAPGFIRRFSFAAGPHLTTIVLWHTAADAHAFFSSDVHQAAMRDLYAERWQYTHFAALWEMTTPRQRVIFCQQCDGVTPRRTACAQDAALSYSILLPFQAIRSRWLKA